MKNNSSQTTLISIIVLGLCISVHSAQSANAGNGRSSSNGHNGNQPTGLEKLCLKVCNQGNPCPPECTDITDPWADTYPSALIKRSPGIDGFTFDDYLFLRWLGRDMKRHRLQ